MRAEIAEGMALRFREHARQRVREAGQRVARPGDINWPLVNALALDPLEGWRYGRIIGALELAGLHEDDALEWWPSPREPVTEFALADRAVFVGLHTGRGYDTRSKDWADSPVQLAARLLGIRPGQAAFRIVGAFGLEVPHVR